MRPGKKHWGAHYIYFILSFFILEDLKLGAKCKLPPLLMLFERQAVFKVLRLKVANQFGIS